MSHSALEQKIRDLPKSDIHEIKLPSGQRVKIGTVKPNLPAKPKEQLKALKQIPAIDLPPIDSDEIEDE